MNPIVLAIAPSNESIVYAMASNGAVGQYRDAVLGLQSPVDRYCQRARLRPVGLNQSLAVFGTFSGNSVYKSTTSGANTLPQVPATAVVVDLTDSNRVYVGTDIGVFTTIDGGTSWYKEVTGFANAPVEWREINRSPPPLLRLHPWPRREALLT